MEKLKREKVQAKEAFKKAKYDLKELLELQQLSSEDARTQLKLLFCKKEDFVIASEKLVEIYDRWSEVDKVAALEAEINNIERGFGEVQRAVKNYNDESRLVTMTSEILEKEIKKKEQEILNLSKEIINISHNRSIGSNNSLVESNVLVEERENQSFRCCTPPTKREALDLDSANLLTRVNIPKFSGNKRTYESWKAAFLACVDNTSATSQYKLLRLRDSLEGEAQRVIESLGYSAGAYEVAKERLERKYGGSRRQIVLRLDELDRFSRVRENHAQDLEKLAELLDGIVVNLTDAGQQSELGGGSLYVSIQRKLNETLLSRFHRWIHEHNRPGNVMSLREFINQESEFQMAATETVQGVVVNTRRDKHRSFVARVDEGEQVKSSKNKNKIGCLVCGEAHGIWKCDVFKGMEVCSRWEKAKELHLCFSCLSVSHRAEKCQWARICGMGGCRYRHHRLLHESKPERNQTSLLTDSMEQGYMANTSLTTGREGRFLALRTVPVILRNGARSVKINALLDDGSTKSYVNSDVAAQLGLEGSTESLAVNVLNDNCTILNTSLIHCILESVDQKVKRPINAYTTKRVTGNMSVINWNNAKSKWKHLNKINFPDLGQRPIVDMLIGIDQTDLHRSLREVAGSLGEPVARLTPLGWTCIGNPGYNDSSVHTNFTFFQQDQGALDGLIRRFWDIDEPDIHTIVKPHEKSALDTVSKSITYEDGRYSVGVPWKSDQPSLPNNYKMARKRLENTEKRLLRQPEVGKSYSDTLIEYTKKGYIQKVSASEARHNQNWYLPHFPVLRPEKSTTKTRIVFDASAKFEEISLNDMVHQGPKLQNNLVEVLLRFRRNPVAIMCDVAEMYLQIGLKPKDTHYHCFLWREMDQKREPDIYRFKRCVFGLNASPFMAQYVTQHHAKINQSKYPLAAETVIKSTYMDDSMDSVPDVTTAIQLYEELTELWKSRGMHARKWFSNSPELLKLIPTADSAKAVDLDTGELPVIKTLGILWNPKIDVFMYHVDPPSVKINKITDAEIFYIKFAQQEVFGKELNSIKKRIPLSSVSRLLPLKPVLDDEGVLRSDGRLKFADYLPWKTRNPVILPREHWVTKLIVKNAHDQCEHSGTNQVLANLSVQFWVLSAREVIRQCERECMVCRRRKTSPRYQIMAPLPAFRTRMSLRAFNHTSVDFGGPFLTKQGRGKIRQKRYLCLFTCMATRAVHLEIAWSLDTDSFLNAFFRMVSRRGLPQHITSDNGTNLVGGRNELRELINQLDKTKIQDSTAHQGIKWHFNPPAAPHFNGVHEIMIKSAKRAIYNILGNADVTDEELLSAIVGAEGLINSRPLTYQSASEKDIVPLTPNHFLHGQIGGKFAPETVDSTDFNPRKRWRRVQELVRHFWGRWMKEWLPTLNLRKKWNSQQKDMRVGDVVLVMATDTPRGQWPLGRVLTVYPGPDGHVRTVDVKVASGVLKRPVVKLCPLDIVDEK